MQNPMVTTARKSAYRNRKQAGTTDCQFLQLWQSGSEERENRIKQRKLTRDRRQKMDAVGAQIEAGQLLVYAAKVCHLKSADLLQLQMWNHLKPIGFQVQNKEQLKGAAAAKVAEKRDKLQTLILSNADVMDSVRVRGRNQDKNNTPSSPQQQDSEKKSSSYQELEDTEAGLQVTLVQARQKQ